jgi:hypothetical protein
MLYVKRYAFIIDHCTLDIEHRILVSISNRPHQKKAVITGWLF